MRKKAVRFEEDEDDDDDETPECDAGDQFGGRAAKKAGKDR